MLESGANPSAPLCRAQIGRRTARFVIAHFYIICARHGASICILRKKSLGYPTSKCGVTCLQRFGFRQEAVTEVALFDTSIQRRRRRRRLPRLAAFESLEQRNMPAVLVDVGHHWVEPDTGGQTVSLSVVSTSPNDREVTGFNLRAQIVTAKAGPYFQSVQFAGDLWNTFPHVESGGPLADRTLALGDVSFTQGFGARADGTLVTFKIDTTGIPAGSYEFRLIATQLGSSSFRQANGSNVSEIIKNGTLQVRSMWQNPDNPNDTNGDGRISPLDLLLVLNELSKNGSRELPLPSPGDAPFPYFDVNGDGFASPKDALNLINCLNGVVCVSVPTPILAQVTPGSPDSTGVGVPVPAKPKSESPPPDPVDEPPSFDCVDENGVSVDPSLCSGSNPASGEPETSESVFPVTEPVSEELPETISLPLPTSSTATGRNFAVVPSAKSVDAVIVEIADEVSDESTSDDLIELGLSSLFAV